MCVILDLDAMFETSLCCPMLLLTIKIIYFYFDKVK